jgi:hypothetical protein
MVERRKPNNGRSTGNGDYDVGYGKPPKHGQFKKGQSGNPAGRPKGLRNFITDVKSILEMPLRLKDGGRLRTKSTQEALLMVLRDKALRGDVRAIDKLMELAARHNSTDSDAGVGEAPSAGDQAILEAYKSEILAEAATPPSPTANNSPSPGSADTRRRKSPNE